MPTPEAGKAHLIARLKGDGSRRPVLLAAHADVVGVEREKWTVDPFAGVVKDGHVYGRGAIDFKGGIAVFARAVMMLAEHKFRWRATSSSSPRPTRKAAPYNTYWLAQTHWAKIDCEFALNEGGWIIKDDDGQGEVREHLDGRQGVGARSSLTATGTSTHSSMPRPDNAIFTLSRGAGQARRLRHRRSS